MIAAAGITAHRQPSEYVRQGGFPHWTLSYQVRGQNDKTVGDCTVRRRAPYCALTRPNTPYRVASAPGHPSYFEYWVIFTPRPGWERLLDWPEEQPGAVHLPLGVPGLAGRLRHEFEEILAFRRGVHPEREALAENALERILLLLQGLRADRKGRVVDERVLRAIEFLHRHLAEPVALDAVATHVSLSPSRLAHLFTAAVGMAPRRYLEAERLEAAKALLLSTNDPVKVIAARVGFANCYHFSTRFRRGTGMSPRAFREQGSRGRDGHRRPASVTRD